MGDNFYISRRIGAYITYTSHYISTMSSFFPFMGFLPNIPPRIKRKFPCYTSLFSTSFLTLISTLWCITILTPVFSSLFCCYLGFLFFVKRLIGKFNTHIYVLICRCPLLLQYFVEHHLVLLPNLFE